MINKYKLTPPFVKLTKSWAIELNTYPNFNFIGMLVHIECGNRAGTIYRNADLDYEFHRRCYCDAKIPVDLIKLYLLSVLPIQI